MALRLYGYPASANCYKVRLLLAQLGLEYERVPVDIFAGDTMTKDYGQKNPALTTPVLELAPGEYLPESNAILLHLADDSELMPGAKADLAQVYRWLFFEQASVVPMIGGLRFRLATDRLAADSDEAQRLRAIAAAILATVEAHLKRRQFFVADEYSVADIGMYGYLHVADETGVDMDAYPNLRDWLDRVRTRPGHIADLPPYPPNSRRGESRSIYDMFGI
jgi:glutathione S-transferase